MNFFVPVSGSLKPPSRWTTSLRPIRGFSGKPAGHPAISLPGLARPDGGLVAGGAFCEPSRVCTRGKEYRAPPSRPCEACYEGGSQAAGRLAALEELEGFFFMSVDRAVPLGAVGLVARLRGLSRSFVAIVTAISWADAAPSDSVSRRRPGVGVVSRRPWVAKVVVALLCCLGFSSA